MNVSFILILLLFGSIATFFAGNKYAKIVALSFSLVSVAASFYILNQFNHGVPTDFMLQWIYNPIIFVYFKVDGLSLLMLLLTTILTSIIIFSSFGNQYDKSNNFYALVLFMSFAMVGTFLSADGFMYYIFWELALLPIYFISLIWGNGDADERKKAVIKFFVFTLAGSLFMLIAFMYLYRKAGTLLINDMYAVLLTQNEQIWIFLAFFMAYAIKIPIIPFHTWQANVYQKSPTVGTMLLSGIMLKMGLYSVIRWQLPIAPFAAKTYMTIIIGLCIAGVIYGSIIALKQKNIKKLFAYSSLAHVGLIAAGAYTLTFDGLQGAIIQMLAHGFVVVGLFFASEVIERRFQTQEIAEMGGIRVQNAQFTSMFMIVMLASVALPGTFNFIGEFTLLYSLSVNNMWFAILGGTTIIFGAVYMFKMFQHVMLGETNSKVFSKLSTNEIIVFVLIIAVLLFFGLFPKPISDLINPSLQVILKSINKY